MIGRLKGIVDFIGEDYLILDVNGVGYRVFCSGKTLMAVPRNVHVTLLIETNVKEDRIHLFGFLSELDKVFYNELCKINGVGNKVALKLMSILTTDEITFAAKSEDKGMFSRVPGIGPKLAQRIATELKTTVDKVFSKIQGESVSTPKNKAVSQVANIEVKMEESEENDKNTDTTNKPRNVNFDIAKDAISALENLGYRRNNIYPIIMKIVKENLDITLETLITEALKEISAF